MNDIEGRRNRVFEDDKDIDEYSGWTFFINIDFLFYKSQLLQ